MSKLKLWVAGVVTIVPLVAGTHLLEAEPEQPVGTWAPMGAVADSRLGAATVTLSDGRSLMTGGVAADGSPTASVVIYDPLENSITATGSLTVARVGHTATLLADGRVLVTGGTVGAEVSSDVELFDPSTGASTIVASLSQPRAGHAAARLPDDSVVIVGGSTIDSAVLGSIEIVDPSSGLVTPLDVSLHHRRSGASATTLLDGRVLVAGGMDGTQDLSSAEIFDPYFGTFTLVDSYMSVARSGHSAVLLPHNNSVLIAGGTTAGQVSNAADLFLPAEFPDPFSWGIGRFVETGALTIPRTTHITGPAGDAGYAFVSGGGPGDGEAYRYATIATNKDDYRPGERAIITGTGWVPGESVTLVFQEDPAVHDDYVLIVQADGAGNLYSDEWAPDDHDLGVRFYLTAAGSQSRAQMTFTDDVVANDVAGPSETVTIMPGGSAAVTFTLTASNTVPAGDASGCNATGSSRATLTVSRPPVVTVSPGSGEFVGCGNGLSFTFSSSVVGSYPIGVSVTGGKVGSSYNTAAAAFTLVVAAANAAPVANAQNVATPEDSPLALTLTASDADNDVVTFSVVAPPAHGVVTGTLPNVTYTPRSRLPWTGQFHVHSKRRHIGVERRHRCHHDNLGQ